MDNNKVIPKREEMNPEFCWKLTDMFESDESWKMAYEKLKKRVLELAGNADADTEDTETIGVKGVKGMMSRSPEAMYRVLQACDEISREFEAVYVYANQKYHQDTANQTYQEMSGKAQALQAACMDAMSFVEPELMAMPEEKIQEFLKAYEPLGLYERKIQEILRQRAHILSEEQEQILAKAAEMGNAPQQIFMAFNNADIDFGTIKDAEGQEVPLTNGRYTSFMESEDRSVREAAFTRMYEVYGAHKNTLAATFGANLKQEQFFAGMRHYDTTLQAALDGGNVPQSVYDQLIEAVHNKLPAMYHHVNLRKKMLGLDEIHMYDVYVPMVRGGDKKISYDEAKAMVKEGLSVLGEEYIGLLEQGFEQGWIDVYENQGKRSGAYSWGAYGTHPYVLLNYSGNLNAVFTLAHEMGHALHSYYSDLNQPYTYAGYRIFVAEVASTCNEALLIRYMIEHAQDEQEKAYLINYFLDQFKGTVYRQTMFAEFEKKAHEKMKEEGSVSAQALCDMYFDLNKLYFGDGMVSDPQIALEWMRIPHFYTPFYVYQYATGFSAAIAIASKILAGEPGIVDKYKRFLSGGCSQDPIDLLKICGVDMTKKEPVEEALAVFENYLKELESLS